ncbi:RHS repeat protein, partial [Pelomonas sp. HMWF004]
MVNGMPRVTAQSQPAGSGCAASVKRQDYDANGNVAWSEDFKGYRTCFAHDLSRNLETDRVEGLAASTACGSLLAAGAALPGNARRTSTQWHPVWHLETKLAEPRRLTTKVYNGQ